MSTTELVTKGALCSSQEQRGTQKTWLICPTVGYPLSKDKTDPILSDSTICMETTGWRVLMIRAAMILQTFMNSRFCQRWLPGHLNPWEKAMSAASWQNSACSANFWKLRISTRNCVCVVHRNFFTLHWKILSVSLDYWLIKECHVWRVGEERL